MKTVSITVEVTTEDSVDPAVLAEQVFDFLTEDLNDYFPSITTVDTFNYKVLS